MIKHKAIWNTNPIHMVCIVCNDDKMCYDNICEDCFYETHGDNGDELNWVY